MSAKNSSKRAAKRKGEGARRQTDAGGGGVRLLLQVLALARHFFYFAACGCTEKLKGNQFGSKRHRGEGDGRDRLGLHLLDEVQGVSGFFGLFVQRDKNLRDGGREEEMRSDLALQAAQ